MGLDTETFLQQAAEFSRHFEENLSQRPDESEKMTGETFINAIMRETELPRLKSESEVLGNIWLGTETEEEK